jgi:hypothetical protein
MTLTGAFPAPPPGGVTVWLGAGAAAAPCGNVTLVNASQIECVTGDAGWPRPSAAVARVRVVYDGWGEALHEPAANGSTEVRRLQLGEHLLLLGCGCMPHARQALSMG